MAKTVSRAEFAITHGVTRQAIDHAAAAGRLQIAPDGRIDPDAPASLAYAASRAAGEAGAVSPGLAAKVGALSAKAALLRQRLDDQEAGLVERDAWLRANLEHVPLTRAWLGAIPECRAAELAAALGCPVEVARGVLTELVGHVIDELGDIAAEVTAAIEAA